jgi:hypothetical protein
MTIALPTQPKAKTASPKFIDFGGTLSASMGGEDQRLNRLGSRFGAEYSLPPMKAADAQVWISRLIRGRKEKVAFYFPQPGVITHGVTTCLVNGIHISNAEILSLKGIGGGRIIAEGQFLSIIKGGKRYLYNATTTGSGSAAFAIGIQPGLRTALAGDEVVEIGLPMIEGYIKGDEMGWNVDDAKIYGLQFAIDEAA